MALKEEVQREAYLGQRRERPQELTKFNVTQVLKFKLFCTINLSES